VPHDGIQCSFLAQHPGSGADRAEKTILKREQVRSVQEQLPRLDYTTTVAMEEDRAIVRLMVFSESGWGGFSELRVEVSSTFPYTMLDCWAASRLYFNSGKLF